MSAANDRCTKPLPDPRDEREPVNTCRCPRCALSQTTLQQIRERDVRAFASTKQYVVEGVMDARADRRHLLSLVDRMRPYVKHRHRCDTTPGICICGLDALLEELK